MLTMVMRWVWGCACQSSFHGKVDDDADADGDEEEQHGLDEHAADAGTLTRAGAQHAGQHDDADDVINDCRADDGRTKGSFSDGPAPAASPP